MPTEYTFTCATCDHVITGHPVFHVGLSFCCASCAADGPCMCSYDMDEPTPILRLVEPVVAVAVQPLDERVVAEPVVLRPATVPAVAVDDGDRLAVAGR